MKTHLHIISHIHTVVFCFLFSVVVSFYVTLLLGTFSVLVCVILSTQIFFGVLVYRYLQWGYDLSRRERCTWKAFLIGMLPAQLLHFGCYMGLYTLFVSLYEHRIFESLPIYRLTANTPVMGAAFLFEGMDVLSFTEDESKMHDSALPSRLLFSVIVIFFVFALICFAVSYVCYRRGVYLNDREHKELLEGIIRVKKGSFAKRFRWIPLVNLLPLFTYCYHHFFCIEYKIRTAVLPLIAIVVLQLITDGLASLFVGITQSIVMYYLWKFVGIYAVGILASTLVIRDER